MLKFNIMEYIYALKVSAEEATFFAFYKTLDKAKSGGKDWLGEIKKIWDNPVVCVGKKFYKLGLDIYKIQLETTDNCSMRYVTCIFT